MGSGLNLLDRIQIALTDLQTNIEFSEPMVSLRNAFSPTLESKPKLVTSSSNVKKNPEAPKPTKSVASNSEVVVVEKPAGDEELIHKAVTETMNAASDVFRYTLAKTMSNGNKDVEDAIVKAFEAGIKGKAKDGDVASFISSMMEKSIKNDSPVVYDVPYTEVKEEAKDQKTSKKEAKKEAKTESTKKSKKSTTGKENNVIGLAEQYVAPSQNMETPVQQSIAQQVTEPVKEVASSNPPLIDPKNIKTESDYVMPLEHIMDMGRSIASSAAPTINRGPVSPNGLPYELNGQPYDERGNLDQNAIDKGYPNFGRYQQMVTDANGTMWLYPQGYNPYLSYRAYAPDPNEEQRAQAINQALIEANSHPGFPQKKQRPVVPMPGLHKEDAPPKIVLPKEGPDDVTLETPEEMHLQVVHKEPPVLPDIIEKNIDDDSKPAEFVNRYDNSEFIEKRYYLKRIQQIANENRMHVKMDHQFDLNGNPTGIIEIHAYNEDNDYPNPEKSFAIDTGHIINKQVKMYPTIVTCNYESIEKYFPVFYNTKKGSKARRNQLDEDMFQRWFKGGIHLIDRKPMHSAMFSAVNMCVDLITQPEYERTHTKIQEPGKPSESYTVHEKEKARRVWESLVKAYKEGVFQKALSIDPGVRFKFEEGGYHESKDGRKFSFILTSEGVPTFLGGPIESQNLIRIKFNEDGTRTMMVNDRS